ncbi:cystathionine beta-lyase [Intrasporangium chromatireducens Q5-1]|uniref:cysteine-S-conjugate beta-lyase n=1 Tax=Intrasporangium chromatireducens Q5-1 TaxID=584657 RepID=W9GMW7_9MICO|nr:aminotransferase class I/II-fold pyridoxal phosphate-dependent enzyme [Intrasporangium chromatireducens]EWT06163.1 cystathionine beta-lyase [Intrasporangium chromatireducens Q5-1]
MTRRILDHTVDELRRDRTSIKWRLHPGDVLPLWVAEMDASPCEAVVTAVTEALRRGDTGYAAPGPYAAALAAFAHAEWGWTIDGHTVVQVADVLTGIARLLELFTEPGGPVIVSSPAYNAFFTVIDSVGRQTVDAPLTAEGRLDLDHLGDAFRRATAGGGSAAYLLCNPHNPTGTVHTADELARLAALAREHGVQVISDEIHAPLVYATSTFTPYLTVPGSEGGVTVTAASKAWNLAGLKAGLVVPGTEAVAATKALHPFVTMGASHLGVIAQSAAWGHGGDWLRQLRDELDDNRHLLARLVAEQLPGVRLRLPESTYLAWLDCRDAGLGDDPAATLLSRGRVALSEGAHFGPRGAGCARLNFATSPEILREAVHRMASCLG